MNHIPQIGVNITRKEAWNKVTGATKYNADTIKPNMLYAKLLTSSHAHALIKHIDISRALKLDGVYSVITGNYLSTQIGSVVSDRYPIAYKKVRYFGEPVALVVANSESEAMKAVKLIKVDYEPLPIINTISDALKPDASLIHEKLHEYYCPVEDVYPQANTNIADHIKIRKGNVKQAWSECDVIVEGNFTLPKSDHIAMEVRNTRAEILPNGKVIINTSSQTPFSIRHTISKHYNIPEGDIIVRTPLVGGAFGGKSTVDLEILAYLASRSVGGRLVQITNTREEDIATSPSKIALEANIKIGATKDGLIKAMKATYYVDCGAYANTGPRMAKAMAVNGSGPYNIEYIHIDAFTVYTNHNYVTSFRGFGHSAFTFCIERMMDKLASKLKMDPIVLRTKNIISPGTLTPTKDRVTLSNTGDLKACIEKLRNLINWDEYKKVQYENGMIRAKGISCFWKTSTSPTNATSGVILTLNSDGSINLSFGAVEIGPGMKTTIAQILAEKMKISVKNVHVTMYVDTQVSPNHWKTVASMTTFMVGNAVIDAADNLIHQLQHIGSIILKCPPKDLMVANQRVYLKANPEIYIDFKDIAYGYKYPNGESIGGQIIAHGNYIMKHLTPLNKETGEGKVGPSWTLGAQAVEIEYDPKLYTYRLLKAATVIDVGKVINPKTARGVIMGGMSMGLGLVTREMFIYDPEAILENTSLRTYKLMRYGENPEYIVDFIETPQIDGPFGAKGLGEHGIIGIPAAFANAISLATEMEFDKIPILPEEMWKKKTGGKP